MKRVSLLLNAYRREALLLGVLLLVLLLVGLRSPVFVGASSLDALWQDSALLIMMALAQMPIVLSRGIDLSVASNLALSGMAVALLARALPDTPIILLLLAGILVGLLAGCINALLITLLELPPIVVTLGTLSVFRGSVYLLSGGEWLTAGKLPPALLELPNARWLGLTPLQWLSMVALLGAWLLIHNTRWGREVRAIGGNPTAARYAGIPVDRRTFALYALSGAVSGLIGTLWVARYAIAYTEVAQGLELQVIAACVLGGVSIAGGVGTVFGTALGALFLVLIYNALPTLGISPFWQTALVGVAILAAALLNQRGQGISNKHILARVEETKG